MSTDDNGNLIGGFIADLRLIRSPIGPMDLENDMPEDCEDAAAWLDDKPNYVPLLAITTKDKKNKPSFSGDSRFKPQMDYLIKNTDTLSKRNEVAKKETKKRSKKIDLKQRR